MMMMVMKVIMMMMQAKMASVTRGYHEHRKGILLKVPINPTPGLPTDLHHSHTISISANLNSLLSHHLTKKLINPRPNSLIGAPQFSNNFLFETNSVISGMKK